MRNFPVMVLASVSALLLGLSAADPASAAVHLRFDPPDAVVAVGDTGRLAICIDDTVDVRSIIVTVSYDSTIVHGLGGQAGALYDDSGYFVFQGFEADTLGTWYGYAIIMGADLHLDGPGELFVWDYVARTTGVCPVVVKVTEEDPAGVYISNTAGDWYPEVLLPPTTIRVGSGLSGVLIPGRRGALDLRLWPNPFNPGTLLEFSNPQDGPVRLEVFDVAGRSLGVLVDGYAPAGTVRIPWDGTDDRGLPAAAGIYLFRLRCGPANGTGRGILLK
ncbi:MAG: FlgD immunoglobulin-like domain containing protein [Candidatus Krumholzibacteriia bacterium]